MPACDDGDYVSYSSSDPYGEPQHRYGFYSDESSYGSDEYVHCAAQDETPKTHARKASYHPSTWTREYYSPTGSISPYYDSTFHYARPWKDVFVAEDRNRKYNSYASPRSRYQTRSKMRNQSQPIYIYDDDADYATAPLIYRAAKRQKPSRKNKVDTYFYYGEEQVIDDQPKRSRVRRSSTIAKPTQKSKPNQPDPADSKPGRWKPTPIATEADAIREGIPLGYSIKHWDPSELPIILLENVFDAKSFGTWIYDWTGYAHGASTHETVCADTLRVELTKCTSNLKRARECVSLVDDVYDEERIDSLILRGERLWSEFRDLLKECEQLILRAVERDGNKAMRKKAGLGFASSLFGRDKQLQRTAKLSHDLLVWNTRCTYELRLLDP